MFLDVNMPNMNGFDVIKNITQKGLNLEIKNIIICTGDTDYESVSKYKSIGVTTILQKPFNIAKLKNILSEKL